MGFYALSMAAIASILNRRGRPATDLVLKFLEHFALISEALETQGLWDEEDGFFYDRLRLPDGVDAPVKVRSIVGILPLLGVAVDRRGRRRARGDASTSARRRCSRRRAIAARDGVLRRAAGMLARRRRRRPRAAPPRRGSSTRTSSSRRTGCARSRAATPSTRSTLDVDGHARDDRLRAGRVDDRACSAATRTGAGRSGCRSTSSSSRRSAATRASSATTSRSSTRPAPGRQLDARARSPPTCATG